VPYPFFRPWAIGSNARLRFPRATRPCYRHPTFYNVPNYGSAAFALQCRASAYQELTVLGGLLEPLVPRPFDVRTHLVGSIVRRLQQPITASGKSACALVRRSNGDWVRDAGVDARVSASNSADSN